MKLEMIAQINLNREQEETAIRGRNILEGILKFISVPIKFITQQVDWLMNALGKESNLTKNLDKNIAGLIFNPEDTKKKGQETLANMMIEVEKIMNAQAGFKIALTNLDKKEVKEKKEHMDTMYKLVKDDTEMQMKAFGDKIEQELQLKKSQAEQEDLIDKNKKALALKREKEIADARLSIQQSLMSSLASLGQILFKNAEKGEKFQKALAVTQLAIDTAKAISGAVAQAQSLPFPANIAAIGVGVATVLANIAKAKSILSKVGGSSAPSLDIPSGGADASGGININPQPQASTLLNPDGTVVNPNKEQQPIKAYVVETEMTSSQNRIQSIENRARY